MKNTKHLSITIIILMALISLTFSCSDMADQLRQGIIEVDTDTTLFIEGAEFEVTAIHRDSRVITDPIVTTQFPLLIKPVIIGEWDITVKALYEGDIIGEATSFTNVEEGKKASLSIDVIKAESRLTGISFDTTPTGFSFDEDTFVYDNLTVGNSVESLTITPYSSSGTITVDGSSVSSGTASSSILLTAGTERTISVVASETGKDSKTYSYYITRNYPTPSAVSFSPDSGAIASGREISMTSTGSDDIYYTTDGSTPTTSSTLYNPSSKYTYNGPEEITVKAIAVKSGADNSSVSSATYTIAESRLTDISFDANLTGFSFDAETFIYENLTVENSVSLLTITPYSSSGTMINVGGHTVYSGTAPTIPIPLTAGTETAINIRVYEFGKTAKTYTFKITRNFETPTDPVFTPASGAIASGTEISMTSTGSDAIYYTTDGSTPTTSSTLYNPSNKYTYNGPGEITVKAIAVKSGADNSSVSSVTYTQAESRLISLTFSTTPSDFVFDPNTFSYPGLTYPNSVDSYAITSVIASGTIRLNGFETTSGASTTSKPLTPGVKVFGSLSVTEYGKATTYYSFDVTRNYPTPSAVSFSPASGAIAYGTEISMTSTGSDAIYYTTDGSTPTTSSTLYNPSSKYTYNGPGTVTVRAIGVKAGSDGDSSVSSATYTQASVANLTNIALSHSPSSYTFSESTYSYTLSVPNSVTSITITPTGSGTIRVDGTTVSSGTASSSISLTAGTEKTISVVVSEVGKVSKTYTYYITRNYPTPSAVSFSPASGAIAYGTEISMTSTGSDAIYYTTDGSTPTTSSTLYNPSSKYTYNGPGTVTVKAIAVKTGSDSNSSVSSVTYTQAESRLTGLSLSNNPINYNFAGDSYDYEKVTFVSNVPSFTVTPEGGDIMSVDGTPITSSNPSVTINLNMGEKRTLEIITKDIDKNPTTYTVEVGRSIQFYDRGASFSPRYLEIAPFDIGFSIWSNITNVEVGTEMQMYSGITNTDKIIAQTGHTESAALSCRNFGNGTIYDDWFLPSSDTLVYLYSNTIQGFTPNSGAVYYSSSESTQGGIFTPDITVHGTDQSHLNLVYYKSDLHQVRPVRAF